VCVEVSTQCFRVCDFGTHFGRKTGRFLGRCDVDEHEKLIKKFYCCLSICGRAIFVLLFQKSLLHRSTSRRDSLTVGEDGEEEELEEFRFVSI
jgi:hypothetical protein